MKHPSIATIWYITVVDEVCLYPLKTIVGLDRNHRRPGRVSLTLSTVGAVLNIPGTLFLCDAVVLILNLCKCLVPATMATADVTFSDNRPCL